VYMLAAGAVLPTAVPGQLVDVTPGAFPHRVWRYGLPLYVRI
jgi:hypothetical protein